MFLFRVPELLRIAKTGSAGIACPASRLSDRTPRHVIGGRRP